ncbi:MULTISPECIES: GPW/gp25 family protein [unclassified Campylobacter]|uniref:GPW/gp25 family protein n=1 Tax=unclassified Campylobacter TaxID=2593542 RepID=UPI003D33788E
MSYQISIDENLKRILTTTRTTKTLQPTFGMVRVVDKQMSLNLLSELKQEIISQVKTYEPRIELDGLNFKNDSSGGLEITLSYMIKNSGAKSITRLEI